MMAYVTIFLNKPRIILLQLQYNTHRYSSRTTIPFFLVRLVVDWPNLKMYSVQNRRQAASSTAARAAILVQ